MDRIKTDEARQKWDTGEHWDFGHDGHPTHHWESEHRYDRKAPALRRLFYAPNRVRRTVFKESSEAMGITDDGTYIVIWASVLRDLAGLFLEGVGLVILGHLVSVTTVMMLVGVGLGIFSIRLKTKHIRRKD